MPRSMFRRIERVRLPECAFAETSCAVKRSALNPASKYAIECQIVPFCDVRD